MDTENYDNFSDDTFKKCIDEEIPKESEVKKKVNQPIKQNSTKEKSTKVEEKKKEPISKQKTITKSQPSQSQTSKLSKTNSLKSKSQIKSDKNSSSKTKQLNKDLLEVKMPNEIKIGDMKEDIIEENFESGTELESMLTEEFKSSAKFASPSKLQKTPNEEEMSIKTTSDLKSSKKFNQKGREAEIEDSIEEEIGSQNTHKIKEFKISDNFNDADINEDAFDDDENEETIRSSIYESIEKSTQFKSLTDKKKTIVEKEEIVQPIKIQKQITLSPAKKQSVTPKVLNLEKSDKKNKKGTKTLDKINEECFKEFKIGDAGSKLGNEGFSEDPSSFLLSPTNEERNILNNFKPQKQNKVSKEEALSVLTKSQELKKAQGESINPKEFKIGDDKNADPTEGFESVEGEGDEDKLNRKKSLKEAKNKFKNKLADYDIKQTIKRIETTKSDKITPGEFVICDYKSLAENANDFTEKEKPLSSNKDESELEIQEFSEHNNEKQHQSELNVSIKSNKINPMEFKLGDGDISKFDENDFSNNSKSNVAKDINKSKKRQN